MPADDARLRRAAEALYEEAPCGLLLTGGNGLVLRANRALREWLGVEADALVGCQRFQDLLTVGGRMFYQTHFAPLLQLQGSVAEVKLDLRGAGGERVPVMVNARCNEDGTVSHAVFIAKDRHAYEHELMLARRRAEEAAARERSAQDALRQADRRKDEFLAMLAHELRNPLAPVMTAAHLLQRSPSDAARVRDAAAMIARQVGHLTHLVDDLLDVSRVTRGLITLERRPVDIADAVHAAVEQARPTIDGHQHALHVVVAPGWEVPGDRTRLVQVFTNLLTNAAKYTPTGGRIEVRMRPADGGLAVEVADNGRGIEAGVLAHVFELFVQAERTPDRADGGLGIGLALVRSLSELHGGRASVYSDGPGRGSCFTVWLPARQRPVEATPDSPAAIAVPRREGPLRILVVDDNRDAAGTLAELLELCGHVPDTAATGADALRRIAAIRPDVCILDIGLPDMSGHALAGHIRALALDPAPTLIALTGYGQPQDILDSQRAGFDHHVLKPVDAGALLTLLSRPRDGAFALQRP